MRQATLLVSLAITAAPCLAQGDEYHADVLLAFNHATVRYPECVASIVTGTGQVLGSSTSGSSYSGFLWSPTGGMQARFAVSDANASLLGVTGERLMDVQQNRQLLVFPPPTPQHPYVYAYAITDTGLVVGAAREPLNDPQHWHYRPFVWDAAGGSRTLPIPDAINAVRANDAGLVIGHLRQVGNVEQAYVHDLATGLTTNLSSLMPPMPLAPGTRSEVFDVSPAGHVVGEGYSGTAVQGFVWTAAQGFTWLPALNGGDLQRVHPRGVAADGTVVGYALDGNTSWRGFVWDPVRGMRDLNALTTLPTGLVIDRASRIGEDGWIVGTASGPGWTPPKGAVLRPRRCQQDLGGTGPGTGSLTVCGLPLASGNAADVDVTGLPPAAPAVFAIGLQRADLPLFGGLLVPAPAATTWLLADAAGEVHLPRRIVGGFGPLPLFAQVLHLDPLLPQGVGFSNAVRIDLLP